MTSASLLLSIASAIVGVVSLAVAIRRAVVRRAWYEVYDDFSQRAFSAWGSRYTVVRRRSDFGPIAVFRSIEHDPYSLHLGRVAVLRTLYLRARWQYFEWRRSAGW